MGRQLPGPGLSRRMRTFFEARGHDEVSLGQRALSTKQLTRCLCSVHFIMTLVHARQVCSGLQMARSSSACSRVAAQRSDPRRTSHTNAPWARHRTGPKSACTAHHSSFLFHRHAITWFCRWELCCGIPFCRLASPLVASCLTQAVSAVEPEWGPAAMQLHGVAAAAPCRRAGLHAIDVHTAWQYGA